MPRSILAKTGRVLTFASLVMASLMLALPAHAKGPMIPLSVGNWSGGSYLNDRTEKFSHCAASARYRHGTALHVGITQSLSWSLGFSNPGWTLREGANININLSFDSLGSINVTGRAVDAQFIVIAMPDNSALIRAFREARQMRATIGGVNITFALEGTSRLLPALAECVRQYVDPKVSRAPEASAPSRSNTDEVDKERGKVFNEAIAEHTACMQQVMRDIVPYSSENAETLAQVIVTRCTTAERKVVSLGTALYGASKADIERIVTTRLTEAKKEMVADIVTFRAELAKALMSRDRSDPGVRKPGESGI